MKLSVQVQAITSLQRGSSLIEACCIIYAQSWKSFVNLLKLRVSVILHSSFDAHNTAVSLWENLSYVSRLHALIQYPIYPLLTAKQLQNSLGERCSPLANLLPSPLFTAVAYPVWQAARAVSTLQDDSQPAQNQGNAGSEENAAKIVTFEEAFQQIKEATGVSDTQEVR